MFLKVNPALALLESYKFNATNVWFKPLVNKFSKDSLDYPLKVVTLSEAICKKHGNQANPMTDYPGIEVVEKKSLKESGITKNK